MAPTSLVPERSFFKYDGPEADTKMLDYSCPISSLLAPDLRSWPTANGYQLKRACRNVPSECNWAIELNRSSSFLLAQLMFQSKETR